MYRVSIKKTASLLITSFILLSSSVLGGCGKKTVDPVDDNYRVFYEIFVGSFSDSNGDGVGDIRGIINRMDYLNDGDINSGKSLGIQGIWLSPILASHSYHKYDVTNYYKIDQKFGTDDDLKELLKICDERNVKVIMDLVLNHTASDNLWFSKFTSAHKSGDTSNEYYDFYSWAKKDEIPGGRTFRQIPGCTDQYYECNFSTDMPELNFDNTAVRQAVLDLAKYWIDMGIDGFRFDAVKYVYYGDTVNSVKFWDWFMKELRAYDPDIYCVGECWSGDAETLEYVKAVNCFNFQIAQAEGFTANAVKKSSAVSVFTNYVETYQDKVQAASPEYGMPVAFLSNHDMDRSAGYMMLANQWPQMAANLYILSPGSPFIYYGEEIAAKGTRGGAMTDANRRLAMNWGDGDTVKDPVGADYPYSKQTNGTVKEQLENEGSLLHYYEKLISLRVKYPEIARGDYKSLTYSKNTFGGFEIFYEGDITWLFHNTNDTETTVDLSECSAFTAKDVKVMDFIGQGTASISGTELTIGPRTSVIVKKTDK
jgi:glycosidase